MKYLGIEPSKPRVAVFDFTGCEGCELQLANKEESLVDFLKAVEIVERRLNPPAGTQPSFWVSVSRYPARHAAWEACGELAQLAIAVAEVTKSLSKPPTTARGWISTFGPVACASVRPRSTSYGSSTSAGCSTSNAKPFSAPRSRLTTHNGRT